MEYLPSSTTRGLVWLRSDTLPTSSRHSRPTGTKLVRMKIESLSLDKKIFVGVSVNPKGSSAARSKAGVETQRGREHLSPPSPQLPLSIPCPSFTDSISRHSASYRSSYTSIRSHSSQEPQGLPKYSSAPCAARHTPH